jgi:hypothetical protein
MKNIIALAFAMIIILSACEPRIDLDSGQWGDKAFLTNVQIFKLDIDENAKLVEWHNNDDPMTGIRRIIISNGNAVIDKDNFTATVKLKAGETLEASGFIFYHYGTLIEPMGDAPKAGIPNDLSARSFIYSVHSADGSQHDWSIIIE